MKLDLPKATIYQVYLRSFTPEGTLNAAKKDDTSSV